MISIFGAAKPAMPPVENNSWVINRETGTVMVFVHGVLSSAAECWYQPKTGAFWPHLVRDDQGDLGRISVFLGGYNTEVDAGEYGMRDCAKELLDALSRETGGYPAVLAHERLVFVCHSLGGIVVRYMLECWRELFESKAIYLVLAASPSVGSRWANSLENVISFFRNRTGRELKWRSDSLDDLDRRFKDMRDLGLIPNLAGCEWCEQRFIKLPWFRRLPGFFRISPIVPVSSASRYFGDYHLIPGSDHISIVKPMDDRALVHQLLGDAYKRFDVKFPATMPAPQPLPASNSLTGTKPDLFQCDRISYSTFIYDDGDGHNQMAFEGIRGVRSQSGTTTYELASPWVSRGKANEYLLQQNETSPGVSLLADNKTLQFDPAPSAERPQRFLVERLDAHTYAMDRKELGESGNGRQDSSDYAQVEVRGETAGELVLEVSFPASMSLTREQPFVYAYQNLVIGGEETQVFDSALTRRAAAGFSYSRLLNSVFLRVTKPPQNTAYRLYWRLGEPFIGTLPSTPEQRARLEARRTQLLSARDCFAASGEGVAARKKQLIDCLAKIGDHVAEILLKTIVKTPADQTALLDLLPHIEITVMGMEAADKKILRFVAGTAVAGPDFWDVKMPVGEGIAGRAAKRLEARTYDDEETRGSVFAGLYMELEPGKRHAWLLAVPLWSEDCGRQAIGVLNVGTYDPSRAHILRVLGQEASIRDLASWSNSTFLPEFLTVLSSKQGDPTT
ncbi:MAG: hypothetical protein ABSF22_19460 [Bryobacteraceae bacterium]